MKTKDMRKKLIKQAINALLDDKMDLAKRTIHQALSEHTSKIINESIFDEDKTREVWILSHYLSYIINGDASGLDDGEEESIDQWLTEQGADTISNTDEEDEFGVDEITGLRGHVTKCVLLYRNEEPRKLVRTIRSTTDGGTPSY